MELEYDYFKSWVRENLKVDLNAYKEIQLHRRIGTVMKSAGVKDLHSYSELIRKDERVKREFLDYITINVTEFFRNREIFDEFENAVRNILQPRFGSLRIWSAACSIGAEPYSVAVLLKKHRIRCSRILATDIDDTILMRAKDGRFRENEIRNVDAIEREMFFTRQGNEYRIAESIREMVQFRKHDLLLDSYEKDFHVVICRNVTIYFKNEAKDEVYRKISQSLTKGGIFFTGATETIFNPASFGFRKLSTFLYEKV